MTISALQPIVLLATLATAFPAGAQVDPANAADKSKPAEAAASLQLTYQLI